MANHPNPGPFLQGAGDGTADGHSPDLFDFAPGDRLPVGDDGQGFHQGTGITARTLLEQVGEPGGVAGFHLQAITGGDFAQFTGTLLKPVGQFGQSPLQGVVIRAIGFGKQCGKIVQIQRSARSQQGGFQDIRQGWFSHV